MRNVDTVEEFWTWATVEEAFECADAGSVDRFRDRLGGFLGVGQPVPVPSGRWAIQRILESLEVPIGSTRRVVTTAFNCSVVESAIRNAGFEARVFDFADPDGSYDWDRVIALLEQRPVALIIPHLFGVPVDFRPIIEICHRHGIVIIEDCAHTLGGFVGGAMVGTLGDFGVFSFNYDKPISLVWGGAVVARDRQASVLGALGHSSMPTAAWEYRQLSGVARAARTRRQQIRLQGWRRRVDLPARVKARLHRFDMPTSVGIGPLRAELGIWCLDHYPEIRDQRNRLAEEIQHSAQRYRTWNCSDDVRPAWLKQKVCTIPTSRSHSAAARLRAEGLRVGNFNWPTLIGKPSVDVVVESTQTATCWIDVPVHQRMGPEQMDAIIKALEAGE